MPNELPLNSGTLPAPFTCWQALYDEMFALGSAAAPAITGILIQDAVPAPEDHDKGWIPTALNIPRYPGYVFIWHATLGHWVSRNPVAPLDPSRRIYMGLSTDVATYDGGAAGVGEAGPMWEIDTAFAGSVPVGVGLVPGSSPAATIAAAGDTSDSLGHSGEYQHALVAGEVAGHFHGVGTDGVPDGNDPPVMLSRAWSIAPATLTERFENGPGSGNSWADGPAISTGAMGTTNPLDSGVPSAGHLNMQPYVGAFFLKRTSRQFYIAA